MHLQIRYSWMEGRGVHLDLFGGDLRIIPDIPYFMCTFQVLLLGMIGESYVILSHTILIGFDKSRDKTLCSDWLEQGCIGIAH